MRFRDGSPEQEKQRFQETLGELEVTFHPVKMATQSHTVRSSSAVSANIKATELPLEELLALYSYTVSDPEKETCHMDASLPDMTLDKDQITKDLFPGEEEDESSADDLTPLVTSNTSDLLCHLQGGDKDTSVSSSDEDSEDASIPSNEEKKEIMVGSMYQAKIPPLCPYTYQERAYSSDDQLLWRPDVLPMQEVEEFLLCVQRSRGHDGTQGATVQDDEQALYELVKCNFSTEEALRRLHFNVKVFSEELCSWSEEECRGFEQGYRVYGKNFHLIQANKVRTRSVGECVEYYYMWKKSDCHKYFTQQATRLSRRKYNQSESVDDGEQDGEVGDLEGSNNSSDMSSQNSTRQLETPLPPQSNLDMDKQGGGPSSTQTDSPLSLKAMNLVQTGHRKQAGPADGELMMELSDLCEGGYPQQMFACPFSFSPPTDHLWNHGSDTCCPSAPVQLLSQPSPKSFPWGCGSPPSCHSDPRLPDSCFYQLHRRGGPFVPEGVDFGAGVGGTVSPCGLQVELSLQSASPPSPAVLPSHFQAFGSLLHPPPVQHPRSFTQ